MDVAKRLETGVVNIVGIDPHALAGGELDPNLAPTKPTPTTSFTAPDQRVMASSPSFPTDEIGELRPWHARDRKQQLAAHNSQADQT